MHILMMILTNNVTVTEKVNIVVTVITKGSYFDYLYVGYLCGDCKDNKGVSALLNHCVDCTNTNVVLLAVLCKNYCHITIVYIVSTAIKLYE